MIKRKYEIIKQNKSMALQYIGKGKRVKKRTKQDDSITTVKFEPLRLSGGAGGRDKTFQGQPSSQDSAHLMCRYCSKTSNSDTLMFLHIKKWHKDKPIAARARFLNAVSGLMCYQTKTLCSRTGPIYIRDLDDYNVIDIDFQSGKLCKKREKSLTLRSLLKRTLVIHCLILKSRF